MGKRDNNYGLLFGAAIGVAAGLWLNSKQGKAFRKDFTQSVESYAAKAKKELDKKIEESKDMVENLSEKTRDQLHMLSSKAEVNIEKVESGFERGANKAKAEIEKFDS